MANKDKISITVDKEIIKQFKVKIDAGTFRNKSHAFEFAAKKYLAEQES
jgi:metal-responsive CopG/Arc/MetJ family transcriptional regulator